MSHRTASVQWFFRFRVAFATKNYFWAKAKWNAASIKYSFIFGVCVCRVGISHRCQTCRSTIRRRRWLFANVIYVDEVAYAKRLSNPKNPDPKTLRPNIGENGENPPRLVEMELSDRHRIKNQNISPKLTLARAEHKTTSENGERKSEKNRTRKEHSVWAASTPRNPCGLHNLKSFGK